MPTKVKLLYPVLAAEHQVWMVRPGAGYRLYDAFKASSAIAPDIPLLSITSVADMKNEGVTSLHIRRGLAWRKWEQDGAKKEATPSTSLGDYQLADSTQSVMSTRLKNIAVQIFDTIPKGALVFIPHPALEGHALMGIAADPADPFVPVVRKWGTDKELKFLGRKLTNIIEVPMRVFPEDIASMRKNRGLVVSKIDREYDISIFYREYFKSFALTSGQAYTQYRTGDAELPAGALSGLVAVARFALEAQPRVDPRDVQPPLSAEDLLKRALSPDADLLVHARVNSPRGRVTFQSMKVALFAGTAWVALATLDADAQVLNDLATKTLVVESLCDSLANDQNAAALHAAEVKQGLFDFYATYGADTCEQVLVALRATVEATKGEVDIEAE